MTINLIDASEVMVGATTRPVQTSGRVGFRRVKVGSWVVWHSSCLSRAKCLVELARTSLLDVSTCWVGFFGVILGLIFSS